MAWPLSQDYNEALQNPQTSFSDPELRQGQVVTNALGIPQPCSGNFADVYAVESAAGKTKWAVKCFTREVHGLRERYSAISSYLQQARLPFAVDFQYLEQGVRIGGRWYPILKMHWVEGFTLNAFVRDMLDKPAMLDGLSRIWLRMAQRLREANLAHCDLQHGNVLLVPGSTASSLAVKLIDYDGMWVPALANTPSGEVGHPAYQHPQRLRDSVYNREVDRFPLLAIYVALRALMVGGRQLWERFDSGDNMLFRQADFEAPAQSPLFAELLGMNRPDVRDLAAKLTEAGRLPLDQVPHLTDLVAVETAPSPATRPAASSAATRPAASATEAANAFQDIEATDSGKRSRRKAARGKKRSLVPWLVSGGLAAYALLGGVLFLALRAKGQPDKRPVQPEQQQARLQNVEPAPERKDKHLPQPGKEPSTEARTPSKNEPTPLSPSKEEDKGSKPPTAVMPILNGPLGEVRRFDGHGAILSVAFSPDGRRALAASGDKTVQLWDLASGEEIHSLKGHTEMVWAAAFSPDGKRAVSAGYDNTVRLWDLEKGEEIHIFRGHTSAVRRAVFSQDGKHIFSAGLDRSVRQWDVETGATDRQYEGNKADAYWMTLSADGKHILAGGGDTVVHSWDVGGRELAPYRGSTSHLYAIEFSADGKLVAASGGDRLVHIWRASDRKLLYSLPGHSGQVNALSFLPDGGRLLSASGDGTIRLWDVADGRELGRYYGPEGVKMTGVAVAPDGRSFLSGSTDNQIRLWRLPPPDVLAAKPDDAVGEVQSFIGHEANVRHVAFSFDGRHILSAGYDNTARLWETATGREVLAFKEHKHHQVHAIALLPDGRRALSGGEDRMLRLWGLRNGHEIRALEGSKVGIWSLAVSPDGGRAASGGIDPVVLVWDLEKGEVIRRLEGLGLGAQGVCFSPDGRSVLASGGRGTIGLWDVTSDEPKPRLFPGHSGDVTRIGFSPDGRQVLSASRDRTLRLWDVASGKELRRFEGHTDQIEGVALSPDGRRAVSGGFDRTVRLWDVASGKELQCFEGHTDKIWDVAFSPDGRYVLSASEDKSMKLWRVPFAPFVVGRPLQIKADQTPRVAKLPMPDKALLKMSTDEIKDTYKAEFASRQPAEWAALAVKLLKHGRNEKEKPERRFVFLREASNVAAKAADAALSLQAISEMGKTFSGFEELPMKSAVLERVAATLRGAEANKSLLAQIFAVLDEAEAADDYEQAAKVMTTAQKVAQKSADRYLPAVVAQRRKRLDQWRRAYEKIANAVKTLAANAADVEANLVVGSFECFDKEDWSKGLPLLARGSDTTVAALARKDLAKPAEATAQAELGQMWWSCAEKQNGGAIKVASQRRARHWFRQALPRLSGMEKERIEARLAKKVGNVTFRPGLIAQLYGDEKMEKRITARADYKVDFDWGLAAPDAKLPVDHFSIRWEGILIPPRAGRYTFTVHSDDGSHLYVDGQSAIDFWGIVGKHSKVIELTAEPHRIRLDYHDITAEANVRLLWSLEGGFAEQTIDLDVLYHHPQQERLLAP